MICSGSSDRQVRAIAEGIKKSMKKLGLQPLSVEGQAEGKWVLLDYNDLIVHVFYDETREYFRLDQLWSEAEKVNVPKGFIDKYEVLKETNG